MHFLRNLPSHVPKAGQDMMVAAMKAVFVIQKPDLVKAHWQQVIEMLRKQFPGAVPEIEAARDAVLACVPTLPAGALAQDLENQPTRAAKRRTDRCAWQRSYQTPYQRGRHLPQ